MKVPPQSKRLRYAVIREGMYADAIQDIKYGYYFFIAADEYDFKTEVYTKEEFEIRQERSAENFKREIEDCSLNEPGSNAVNVISHIKIYKHRS